MGCTNGGSGSSKQLRGNGTAFESKLTKLQSDLLTLMFNDLAARCPNDPKQIISRQNFQVFFNATGLMAELLFLKFDRERSGDVDLSEFLEAFSVMVKGTFQEKADALFEFFADDQPGMSYKGLLKVLFSYPITEVNKMLADQKFQKHIGPTWLTYYFGPEHKMEEKTILEENQYSDQDSNGKSSNVVVSVYAPNSQQMKEMQNKIQDMVINNKKSSLLRKQSSMASDRSGGALYNPYGIGSTTELEVIKKGSNRRKQLQLQSNISSATRRYCTFLFVSLNLDKEKDVFERKHFYELLQKHPSIFDAYLTGFHTYVWRVDESGVPEFTKEDTYIEGEAMIEQGESYGEEKLQKPDKRYLKLIKKTIMVFPGRRSRFPIEMVALEGLTVHELDDNDKGFTFSHRDMFYPQKRYIFENREMKDLWLKQLEDYRQSSVFDKYIKLERIGGGNFSNVFRAKQKQAENDKYVAIKQIKRLKLSGREREVLKREVGILTQCHHPNIIKYIEEFKTRTHIYIITELLSEGDLFEYTRRNGFLEEFEAATVFRQLAEAILYINELGVIHRDLKPENVMVIKEEKKQIKRIKLIDFGFGVFKDKLKDLTDHEKYAGTPGFIAPQVYLMQEFDEKIDTFSLGIILYFLLYGNYPFHSHYAEEIQEMTVQCKVSLSNNHWGNVSDEAKDLILKLLTHKHKRITTKQALEHPWLQNVDKLKQYEGRNHRKRILF